MGTTLTGTTPQDTYDSLIKVTDNGPLSGSLKTLTDGLGNDSALALSTGGASVTGTLAVTGNATFDTNTLFVDAAANEVGIGTITPNAVLNVIGEISQGDYSTATNSIFTQRSSGSILSITTTGTTAAQGTDISYSWSNGGQGPLTFSRSAGEVMRLDSAGNVGIGTSSPAYKLEIFDGGGSSLAVGASTGKAFLYADNNGATLGALSAIPLRFNINGSEVGRFLAGGGLTFNGDTAAANALDDYEEGTWTPVFQGSTTNPTVTYAVQSGFYTKIGRQVTITFEVGTSANTGGVGSLQVAGLPFTVGSRVYNCVATYDINNAATNAMSIFAEVNAGGTKVDFLATGDNTTWIAVNWTDATSASIYVNGSFTYFV